MKKLTVLSIIAASLILTGCQESSTGAEAKASQEVPVKTEVSTEKSMKSDSDNKSAATEAKEAAAVAVSKATEAVKEKATELKEKASEKVAEVKEKASEAMDSAKTAVTNAVAKVTGGSDGKALFAKCAGCHGADGKTAALGKSGIIAGQSASDLETKIAGYKAGTLNTAGMGGLMKGQVASYSDADIKAVAGYISGL